MIQVLGYRAYQETCDYCDAILSYNRQDVKTEDNREGYNRQDNYIQCPNCLHKIYVSMKLH